MSEQKFTVKQLYDFIVSKMSPEEALMKLLASSIMKYEHLKITDDEKKVHPEVIIAMAALDLGWDLVVEENTPSGHVEGLMVGTRDYIDRTLKVKKG